MTAKQICSFPCFLVTRLLSLRAVNCVFNYEVLSCEWSDLKPETQNEAIFKWCIDL